MGKKLTEVFDGAQRGGKTAHMAGTAEAIRQYVAGFSKKDREQIQRELEAEGGSEEEPSPQKGFEWLEEDGRVGKGYWPAASDWNYTTYTYVPAQQKFIQWSGFIDPAVAAQKEEIAEDVQDVSFEE
jgi:hypothetical protein